MNITHLNTIGEKVIVKGGGSGGGGVEKIPTYTDSVGNTKDLYYFMEESLANRLISFDTFSVEEALYLQEKIWGACYTYISAPNMLMAFHSRKLGYNSNNEMIHFSIGYSSINNDGTMMGMLVTLTKNGDVFETTAEQYPTNE